MTTAEIKSKYDFEKLNKAVYILKAVVHPTRIIILDLLEQHGELNVGQLSEAMNISHALVSHHLNDMRSKGICSIRRDKQFNFYSIEDRSVLGILQCIDNCQHS